MSLFQFEEIRASRDGRRLMLTYPNVRCVRVQPDTSSVCSLLSFRRQLLFLTFDIPDCPLRRRDDGVSYMQTIGVDHVGYLWAKVFSVVRKV